MNRSRASQVAVATIALATTMYAHVLRAQGPFLGTWTISSWKVAPWVTPAERAAAKPEAAVNGHAVTFAAKKISGPAGIACANPHYEIKNVPFDMLFEGGLKHPADDAKALGLLAPVKTLIPGYEFEFHMRDNNTVLFALSNVIYTMVRKPAAP